MTQTLTLEQIAVIDVARKEGIPLSEIARELRVNYGVMYREYALPRRGFLSSYDYRAYLASKKGNRPPRKSPKEYLIDWARKNGYKSLAHYRRTLTIMNQQRPENRDFAYFLSKSLEHKGLSHEKASLFLNVSYGSIGNYGTGKQYPTESTVEKILTRLGVIPMIPEPDNARVNHE